MFLNSLLLFKLVFKCNPPQSSGHNPIVSSIFTEIDIPFVVCVIYWSLPTSGSPQEIAWNGPKLVYDCVVWAGAVMVLILCPPLLGIYIKLICIVFMECLLKLVNSTAASGWWCSFKHPGGSGGNTSLISLKYLTTRLGHKMRKPITVYPVGSKAAAVQQHAKTTGLRPVQGCKS